MSKKGAEFFPLENLDINVLRDLKKKLIEFDYNEDIIRRRLNLFGPYLGMGSLQHPVLKHLVNTNKPFDILVSLFFLGVKMKVDKIFNIFTKDEIEKLSEMNILRLDSKNKNVVSNVPIYPLKNFFFFTDFTYAKSHITRNSVYMIGADSFYLANAIPEIKVNSALDLGCGSGIHSIIASRISDNVTGVDINPRAINFAKFNAIFNDVGNVNFKLGDLYNPVDNKKFDIILSNPPYIAVPYEKEKFLYRDSGRRGDYHTKKVIESIPQHLKENGICLIYTEIKKEQGMSNKEMIQNLTENKKFKILQISIFDECTCIVCYSVKAGLCSLVKGNFKRYENEVAKWYKNLEKNKINEIIPTILCIRKNENFYLSGKNLDRQNFDLKKTVEDFYYS